MLEWRWHWSGSGLGGLVELARRWDGGGEGAAVVEGLVEAMGWREHWIVEKAEWRGYEWRRQRGGGGFGAGGRALGFRGRG